MRSTWFVSMIVGTVALAAPGLAAGAAKGEQGRERMFQMVKGECKGGICTLSDAELDGLRPEMNRYADRGGGEREMRSAIRASLEAGCKGVCLAETIRAMNGQMDQGRNARQAGETVRKALDEDKRERDRMKLQLSDAQCMERLHARLGSMHGPEQERMRERAGERAGDAGRELQHGPAGAAHEGPARGPR